MKCISQFAAHLPDTKHVERFIKFQYAINSYNSGMYANQQKAPANENRLNRTE